MDDTIEILIQVKDDQYIATAHLFPGCCGTGKNESEAIKRLGESIVATLEEMMANIIKLMKNAKVKRVNKNPMMENRLKLIDSLFCMLDKPYTGMDSLSGSGNRPMKLYLNQDISIARESVQDAMEQLLPFKDGPVYMHDFFMTGEPGAVMPDGTNGFIISMPLNFN